MPALRKVTELRQQEIADAALRLVGQGGLAALNVKALAAELKLSPGALYRHYPSMDSVLEAVGQRAIGLLAASTPDAALSGLEWLKALALQRVRTVSSHPGLLNLLVFEQFNRAMPAKTRLALRMTMRHTWGAVRRALHLAQSRGEIRRDLDVEALLPIVLGTIQMVATRELRSHQEFERSTGRDLEALFKLLEPINKTTLHKG